jgi:hypothetical protein
VCQHYILNMALVHSQVLTLPKIKTNLSSISTNKIPIVQHLIRDEDIIPSEVGLNFKEICFF